jgi:hypothetical protein
MITPSDLTEQVTRLDYVSETLVSSVLPSPDDFRTETKDLEAAETLGPFNEAN